MKFVKWPSIENTYREKHINYFRRLFPSVSTCKYVVTEKLHGANFSVHFDPGVGWKIAKRTTYIGEDGEFYGVWDVVNRLYREAFDEIQEMVDDGECVVRLYGELFGGKIQKGVNYGPEKRIRFFGMRHEDILVSFENFLSYLDGTKLEGWVVPIVAIYDSLDEALEVSDEFTSYVGTSVCEGVVIMPYGCVFVDQSGNTFLLKKKNEKFSEIAHARKPPRIRDEKVNAHQVEMTRYVVDERLQGIFSKYGEITEPKQIGGYIRYMIDDVVADFVKDFPEFNDLTDGQKGQVTKVVGSLTANMLKGYL